MDLITLDPRVFDGKDGIGSGGTWAPVMMRTAVPDVTEGRFGSCAARLSPMILNGAGVRSDASFVSSYLSAHPSMAELSKGGSSTLDERGRARILLCASLSGTSS